MRNGAPKVEIVHQTLSQSLSEVLAENSGGLTINELVSRTENRGIYLILILLSLPFIIPVALPGVSTMLGLTVTWIALRGALGLKSPLPGFIGKRPVPDRLREMLLGKGVRFLRWVEKWIKARSGGWLTQEPVRRLHFLLIAIMGLLLALPFPPLPPLTNSLPAYCIILLSASLLEMDGWMIWVAYALVLVTLLYLGGASFLLIEGGMRLGSKLLEWMMKGGGA